VYEGARAQHATPGRATIITPPAHDSAQRRDGLLRPQPVRDPVADVVRLLNRLAGVGAIQLRQVARVAHVGPVVREVNGTGQIHEQLRIDGRDQVEQPTEIVSLRKLDLMSDEDGLDELLCRLLRVKTDSRVVRQGSGEQMLGDSEVLFGSREPLGDELPPEDSPVASEPAPERLSDCNGDTGQPTEVTVN
jgi:hypothetical protein